RFPDWVRVVATTRANPDVLARLKGLRPEAISAQDARSQNDVAQFIDTRLRSPALSAIATEGHTSHEALGQQLLRSSDGNFLYVVTALNAIESRQLLLSQVADLPPGLDALYTTF